MSLWPSIGTSNCVTTNDNTRTTHLQTSDPTLVQHTYKRLTLHSYNTLTNVLSYTPTTDLQKCGPNEGALHTVTYAEFYSDSITT